MCSSSSAGRSRPDRGHPAVEVHGAEQRFDGVGQDRALVARRRWPPRPCRAGRRRRGRARAATSARVVAFTTAARSLASSPSGMSGYDGEDVVGDHQPEHGVAEELEALVRARARRARRTRSDASERDRAASGIVERRSPAAGPAPPAMPGASSQDRPPSPARRSSARLPRRTNRAARTRPVSAGPGPSVADVGERARQSLATT